MSAAASYHPDEFCSDDEIARRIGYAVKTLRNKRWTGDGPPYSKGPGRSGRVLYRWRDVLDWMESRKRRSTSE